MNETWKLEELFPDSYAQAIQWNEIARESPLSVEEQEAIVEEEIKETFKAIDEEDFIEALDGVADVFFTAAYLKHLDPTNFLVTIAETIVDKATHVIGHSTICACIQEVVDSNFTKFVYVAKEPYKSRFDSLEGLIRSEEERLTQEHNSPIKGYKIGSYVVFHNKNNKVMKPFCYVRPDLESVVENFPYNKKTLKGEL